VDTAAEITLHSDDFDPSVLFVYRVEARERISALCEVDVEVVQLEQGNLGLDELSGAHIRIDIERAGEVLRSFNGVVAHVTDFADRETGSSGFRLTLVPRLWFARLVETLEVFLDTSVPDVFRGKLGLLDLVETTDYLLDLDGVYRRREMVVQYAESDLQFLQRWCEHLGVFYYFTSEPGESRSKLVFGDHVGAYGAVAQHEVAYCGEGEKSGVYRLEVDRQLIPKFFICRDYNDQLPAMELSAKHRLDQGFGGGVIQYGLDYNTEDEGKRFAKIRAEERLATQERFRGTSDQPGFAPGHTFSLTDHPNHGGDLVILEVVHRITQQITGNAEVDEPGRYENDFVAIDASRCFRPPRLTPVPKVSGVVSGIVETGHAEIERHAKLDDQGRYTVRLLFDTSSPDGRKASCPIRMIQPSSGTGYGVHFPLKPGIEVAVAFRGGNPDRPVIVGAVPNPITPSPIDAAVATKSRIKTRSGILIEFEDADRG
jgi:type VI secretion system secreted protein VgrG